MTNTGTSGITPRIKSSTAFDSIIWEQGRKDDENENAVDASGIEIMKYVRSHNMKRYRHEGGIRASFSKGGSAKCFRALMNDLKSRRLITEKIICSDYLAWGARGKRDAFIVQELYNMGISVVFLNDNLETNTQKNVDTAIHEILTIPRTVYSETS